MQMLCDVGLCVFFCSVSHQMDAKDKHDVHGKVRPQLSDATQEITKPTESDINQDRVLSIVSTTDIPTYCTNDYTITRNIKSEYDHIENTQEDNECSHQIQGVHSHASIGLRAVTYGYLQQKITEQNVIPKHENTSQEIASTPDANDVIEVKQEIESYCDEYDGKSDLTRHWITCLGGVLKEVKSEHTSDVADVKAVEYCREKVDHREMQNVKTHANIPEMQMNVKLCSNSTHVLSSKQFRRHRMDLRSHDGTHLKAKVLPDDLCEKSSSSSSFLTTNHTSDSLYTNTKRSKSFTLSDPLRVPQRVHLGKKPFTCDTCGKLLACIDSLKMHERIHFGVKSFKCDMCGKSFLRSSELKAHETTHTGVKPFTCATCGKSFICASLLKVHERKHTGERPFLCDTCGKSFVSSYALKLHGITHAGVTPFTCATCGKSFVYSFQLKIHENTHTQL